MVIYLGEKCKEPRKLTENEKKNISELGSFTENNIPESVYHGKGCDTCLGSGYRGRIGIYEVMVIDDLIREAMLIRSSAVHIKKLAMERGMSSMVEDGYEKVLKGVTTLEEVLRVIHE